MKLVIIFRRLINIVFKFKNKYDFYNDFLTTIMWPGLYIQSFEILQP
jgi:hypothetical protein